MCFYGGKLPLTTLHHLPNTLMSLNMSHKATRAIWYSSSFVCDVEKMAKRRKQKKLIKKLRRQLVAKNELVSWVTLSVISLKIGNTVCVRV